MLALPILYILIFEYYTMTGIQLAFKKFDPNLGIWGSEWVGLANFKRFFKSYYFERVLTNTLRISIYSLVAGFPIPIIFALMLNCLRNQKFKKVVQMISYMPHFISTVVLVGMLFQVLNPRIGLFGVIYSAITGGTEHIDTAVVRINFNIYFFCFRHNCYGNGRSLDTSLGFCYRNSLYTMSTALIF